MSTFSKAAGRGKRPRDIMAMRLVVPDGENGEEGEAACYAAMRACHRLWESTGEFKDYIAFPKENGYRSLHETVRLPCGRLMEVQIRSASMHDHAERGAAAPPRRPLAGSGEGRSDFLRHTRCYMGRSPCNPAFTRAHD